MIILLSEFDLPHVKTTNPAYLVVSGEKRELQVSLNQSSITLHIHTFWISSWALVWAKLPNSVWKHGQKWSPVFHVFISNMRDSASSGYPNTKKRVKMYDAQLRVFLTDLRFLDSRWNTVLSVRYIFPVETKTMLIKTRYRNLLCGCDFLCFNLNYSLRNELHQTFYCTCSLR